MMKVDACATVCYIELIQKLQIPFSSIHLAIHKYYSSISYTHTFLLRVIAIYDLSVHTFGGRQGTHLCKVREHHSNTETDTNMSGNIRNST